MPVEYVTRGLSFENLYVEITVCRYICDDCGRRECFHDNPTAPIDENHRTPDEQGWALLYSHDDGAEQGCRCRRCADVVRERVAERFRPTPVDGVRRRR